MSNRNLLIGITVIASAFGLIVGRAQTKLGTPATSNQGRFQLYQLDHYLGIAGATAPVRFTSVFKIDTQTGETKLLVAGADQNGARNFWQKID